MLLGLRAGQIDDRIVFFHFQCIVAVGRCIVPRSFCCLFSAYLANTEVSLAKTRKYILPHPGCESAEYVEIYSVNSETRCERATITATFALPKRGPEICLSG